MSFASDSIWVRRLEHGYIQNEHERDKGFTSSLSRHPSKLARPAPIASTFDLSLAQNTDAGNYQPPRADASLSDDPLAEEGRGAFLIARLVDTVEHAFSVEGHSIQLTKRVALAEMMAVRSNGSTTQNKG